MKTLKASLAITTLCIFFSAFSFAQKKKEKSPVEGKTYLIKTTEVKATGKPSKELEDKLIFKSEKISSSIVKEKTSFDPLRYILVSDSLMVDADGAETRLITFEAEGTNEKEELLKWEGTIEGEEIEGTVIWSKNGKTKKEFTFYGSEKTKKK